MRVRLTCWRHSGFSCNQIILLLLSLLFHGAEQHVLGATVQGLVSEIDSINAEWPSQKAAIKERIADLLQLSDPQQLTDAMAALHSAIAAGGAAAEAVIRRSEGMQLALHERYLDVLKQQARIENLTSISFGHWMLHQRCPHVGNPNCECSSVR